MQRLFVPLSFLISLILLLWFIFAPIANLSCTVGDKPCDPQLENLLQPLVGRAFFITDIHSEIKILLAGNARAITSVKRELPATLSITFAEDPPAYILNTKEAQPIQVSLSGATSSHAATEEKLIVFDAASHMTSDFISTNEGVVVPIRHQVLVGILQAINNSLGGAQTPSATIIWEDNTKILLKIPEKPLIIISTDSMREKPYALTAILQSQQINTFAEPISEIDARFNLPVLRTQQ